MYLDDVQIINNQLQCIYYKHIYIHSSVERQNYYVYIHEKLISEHDKKILLLILNKLKFK